eukprot:2923623-Rhodomonas_salina.1
MQSCQQHHDQQVRCSWSFPPLSSCTRPCRPRLMSPFLLRAPALRRVLAHSPAGAGSESVGGGRVAAAHASAQVLQALPPE